MTLNVQQTFLRFHGWAYQRTNGRIGHHMIGVPTLLLDTTGRRSGARRTNALVYAQDGVGYVVVASKGGSDQPPAWLLNLRAQPQVEIQVARARRAARAAVVERGEPEYARLWRLVNDRNHQRYDGYQTLTKRPIPLVTLTPI
ncbi:MAG TPA: nitroreductase/quinone reductase family protein [Candidatus Acidoferrales bacterium]|nr:nitroreductase/quinone reductase family protein [Candidatus Acidoferrales bacterium]